MENKCFVVQDAAISIIFSFEEVEKIKS